MAVSNEGSRPNAATEPFTDADVAALAAGGGVARLGLLRCGKLTDAALAPFSHLTSLVLTWTLSLTSACWAPLAGRLRSVATDGTGPITDAHLAALTSCTHVSLGYGAAVTDTGVAAHLAPRVTHLRLDVTKSASFDGSCLRACTCLVDLRLTVNFYDYPLRELVPDALAGCAATLATLSLGGVDGGDALFTAGGSGLPALRRATLEALLSLTDAAFSGTTPRLEELEVCCCDDFVGGGGLGPLPALTSLEVTSCEHFTGRALAAGSTPALQWLRVLHCARFGEEAASGGGGGGGVAQPLPQPSAAEAALSPRSLACACPLRPSWPTPGSPTRRT
jgi:hypothetical protein